MFFIRCGAPPSCFARGLPQDEEALSRMRPGYFILDLRSGSFTSKGHHRIDLGRRATPRGQPARDGKPTAPEQQFRDGFRRPKGSNASTKPVHELREAAPANKAPPRRAPSTIPKADEFPGRACKKQTDHVFGRRTGCDPDADFTHALDSPQTPSRHRAPRAPSAAPVHRARRSRPRVPGRAASHPPVHRRDAG